MTPILKCETLEFVEADHGRDTPFGRMHCKAVSAWPRGEKIPCLITAAALFVDLSCGEGRRRWVLEHLLVQDDERRGGIGTALVRFYEGRLGPFRCCWASPAGAAFGRAYVNRYGARPLWQIGPSAAIAEAVEMFRRAGVKVAD